MSTEHSTCSHCGKPLKRQACYACEGKGYARELALMKKECAVCHGSGWIWRCEDEFRHIVEDFKAAHPVETGIISKPLKHRPATAAETAPDWEPSPLHPINPENPWNVNNLSHLANRDTLHPISQKHRPNRNAVKK